MKKSQKIGLLIGTLLVIGFIALFEWGVQQEYKAIDTKYDVIKAQIDTEWVDYNIVYNRTDDITNETVEFKSHNTEEHEHNLISEITKGGEHIGTIEPKQEKRIVLTCAEFLYLATYMDYIELEAISKDAETGWDRYDFSLVTSYNDVTYKGHYVALFYKDGLRGVLGEINSENTEYTEEILFKINYVDKQTEVEEEYQKFQEDAGIAL